MAQQRFVGEPAVRAPVHGRLPHGPAPGGRRVRRPRLRDLAGSPERVPPPVSPEPLAEKFLWRRRHVLLVLVLAAAALVAGYLTWRPNGSIEANNVNDVAEAVAAGLADRTTPRSCPLRCPYACPGACSHVSPAWRNW